MVLFFALAVSVLADHLLQSCCKYIGVEVVQYRLQDLLHLRNYYLSCNLYCYVSLHLAWQLNLQSFILFPLHVEVYVNNYGDHHLLRRCFKDCSSRETKPVVEVAR